MDRKDKAKDEKFIPKKKPILSMMTPRNLVPATPIRFNTDTSASSSSSVPIPTAGRVIKGPKNSGKDKSAIPLAPGYTDRAAQRRSGQDSSKESFNWDTNKEEDTHTHTLTPTPTLTLTQEHEREHKLTESNTNEKEKYEFLKESEGISGFPKCFTENTELILKRILFNEKSKSNSSSTSADRFRPEEAFLQFKSIEETKTQPFDLIPKRIFRMKTKSKSNLEEQVNEEEEEEIVKIVQNVMLRLQVVNETNQKYLETLSINNNNQSDYNDNSDIFPEAGRFKEEIVAAVVNTKKETEKNLKAKDRLFKSKTLKTTKQQQRQPEEEEKNIFNLIAQKTLQDESDEVGNKKKGSNDEGSAGGLFGFSSILPKLSRLHEEEETNTKISGIYSSILQAGDEDLEEVEGEADGKAEAEAEGSVYNFKYKLKGEEEKDQDLYPGYLDNSRIGFDSDDDDFFDEPDTKTTTRTTKTAGTNKRKLGRKADKDAEKVEKIVKSKYGINL